MPPAPEPAAPDTFPLASPTARLARARRALARYLTLDTSILAFCSVLIVLAWVTTIERVRFEEEDEARQVAESNTNLAIAYEEHTASTLRGIDRTLKLLVYEFERHGANWGLQDMLATDANHRDLYKVILVFDRDGKLVAGPVAPSDAKVADRDYFSLHKNDPRLGMLVGKPVLGRFTREWIVPMSRRIDAPDGSFNGVIVASVDPHYFTRFYQKADLGAHGLVALIGLDGTLRARRAGDERNAGETLTSALFLDALKTKDHGNIVTRGSRDGVPRYVSYRRVEDYPLAIIVGVGVADVQQQITRRGDMYYAFAALATLALVLVAAAFRTSLARARRAGEALRSNEARYRATFDHAAIGIAHVDIDGKFLRANRRYCDTLGYAEDDLVGRSVLEVTPPDDQDLLYALRDKLSGPDSDAIPITEKRSVRKDGHILWVTIAVNAVRDAQGRPQYFVVMLQDISARKHAEERYHVTFNQAAVGIAHADLMGRFISVNRPLAAMVGYTEEEMCSMTLRDIVPAEDLAASYEERNRIISGAVSSSVAEHRYVRKDGSIGFCIRTLSPVRDAAGNVSYLIATVQDISKRKSVENALIESQQQFEQLASHIPEAFWIYDVRSDSFVYMSPAFEHIAGRPFASAAEASKQWLSIVHIEDRRMVVAAQRTMITENLDIRYRLVRPDGTIRWVHSRGFPVRNAEGSVYRVAGTVEDVTERQLLEERLQYQAHYDALTSLPNRVLSADRLRQALEQARRKNWIVAVLFIDLDRFKVVNDTLGHAVGDRLLQQVSQRLRGCIRAGDTVGRLGGDEFVIVLSDLNQGPDAGRVAAKVIAAIGHPFELDGHEVFITASIGIAMCPEDGRDADALLRNADAAMFSAKNLGKNNYQFYTAAMNERALEKLILDSNLRRALERNEFVLHFQPKVSLATGAICGCEALLRWEVPGNGLVSPAQFVPLLEESGLIVPIGQWVVREACRQVQAWGAAGLHEIPVAVNLSARQFQHSDIAQVVASALDEFRIDPAMLELEVTETAAMRNAEETVHTLGRLKAIGVRIAIDDFGTGYSSLTYLKRFPVDALKLDRSFVKDLPDDLEDAAIARSVILLAHSLDLEVVAEGVETNAQLEMLAAHGCDQIQGYVFSIPVTAAAMTAMLREGKGLPWPGDRQEPSQSAAA
ncbi:MAG TPA: EAL domain-containing protein [Casimicrobiaceae bacterium]|nr:EAL domain-containing protein [Casimicrobiaceae bacterium]